MIASFLGNIALFISSYYLVFVYLIFGNEYLNSTTLIWNIPYSWSIFITSLVIESILLLYLFKWKELPTNRFHVVKKENTSVETLNYILTILLAIVSINTFSWNLLVLLLLVYLIYVAGGIYYLQPLLVIFGYRVYKCRIEGEHEVMIITKDHITQNRKYTFHELFNSTYILKRGENDN